MRRITELRMMRIEISAAVHSAGLRRTARHLQSLGVRVPLSTLSKHAQRDDWTVEELVALAPVFGGRLFLEMPDNPADRAAVQRNRENPFYR